MLRFLTKYPFCTVIGIVTTPVVKPLYSTERTIKKKPDFLFTYDKQLPFVVMTDNRLVWDTHFTSIYHVCAWHPSAAHSNTAPRWVKAARTAGGHHQTWHEFVWCAKLRRVWAWLPSGRTEEVSGRAQSWASHREGINESWSLKLKSSRQSKLIQASEIGQGDNGQKQYKRETTELRTY